MPERQPRLHRDRAPAALIRPHRSTKAGASTPATRGMVWHAAIDVGRSTKAGASTPATPVIVAVTTPFASALNEGRSVNPGYTRRDRGIHADGLWRSTKAGASTPATRARFDGSLECLIRSTKAGASTPATPGEEGVAPPLTMLRSTKAGASTPATRASNTSLRRRPPTLNEGRSVNPGYTWYVTACSFVIVTSAQRRPERQPRLHC